MQGKKQTVYPIRLGITTAYLIQGSRSVLVDSGGRGSATRILKQLAARGVDPREIALIVLTHGHTDHTGDLARLKEKTGAPVAAHCDEVEALKRGVNLYLKPTGLSGRLFKLLAREDKPAREQAVGPDIIINKEMDMKPFGVKGKVIATPGHTPGSVSLILAGGEAIIGDLLMGGMIFRRKTKLPFFAYDQKRLARSVRLILKCKPSIIYTGHGGPLKPEKVARLKVLLSG